jgi:hypothetical protein
MFFKIWRRDSQTVKFAGGSGGMIDAQSINNVALLRTPGTLSQLSQVML